MVINDLNPIGISLMPGKADAPLIIDTDTLLTFPVALERFKVIGRGNTEILKSSGILDHPEFTPGNLLDISWQTTGYFASPDFLRFFTIKAFYHNITHLVI